jgi:hypothetical protein
VWMVEHRRFGGSFPCYNRGAAVGVGDRSAKPALSWFSVPERCFTTFLGPTLHRIHVIPCSCPSGAAICWSEN